MAFSGSRPLQETNGIVNLARGPQGLAWSLQRCCVFGHREHVRLEVAIVLDIIVVLHDPCWHGGHVVGSVLETRPVRCR